MTGLFLLVVFVIWLIVVFFISKAITSALPKRNWSWIVRLLVMAALVPLPLVDEIIGARQFARLCKEHSEFKFDSSKVTGKNVYLESAANKYTTGTAVPIRIQSWKYNDTITDSLLVSYETLNATGGWLIRSLRISEGDAPLTFKSYCAPGEDGRGDYISLFKQLQVNLVERNQVIKGEKK